MSSVPSKINSSADGEFERVCLNRNVLTAVPWITVPNKDWPARFEDRNRSGISPLKGDLVATVHEPESTVYAN